MIKSLDRIWLHTVPEGLTPLTVTHGDGYSYIHAAGSQDIAMRFRDGVFEYKSYDWNNCPQWRVMNLDYRWVMPIRLYLRSPA